jgi:hypothetical protein
MNQPRSASAARPPSPLSLLGLPPLSVAVPASAAPELDPFEVAAELLLPAPAEVPLLPLLTDEELPCRSWRSGLPLPISVLCPQATIAAAEIIMKETATARHRVRAPARTRFPSSVAPASESTLR